MKHSSKVWSCDLLAVVLRSKYVDVSVIIIINGILCDGSEGGNISKNKNLKFLDFGGF